MTFDGADVRGGWPFVGPTNMHSMPGLSPTRHVHDIVGHVHWSRHCGTILSSDLEFWLIPVHPTT